MVTAAQIKKFCPSAKPALVNAIVANWPVAVAAGISTDLRIQHFMAQIAVETRGLTSVEESLNYSVEGLLSTFGRHRISEADAKKYGRTSRRKANQKAIANIVYGGAWGKENLGNTQPNDGWDMRGGGMGQTTGRANYRDLGFEDNPDALRDPETAFKTAVAEWVKRKCNRFADTDDVTGLRKVWNGGTNGLADAKTYLKQAKKVFVSGVASAVVSLVDSPLNGKTVRLLNTEGRILRPSTSPGTLSASKPVAIPVPTPKPAVSTHEEVIRQVQDLLWDKGYPEVGESDGKFGARTRNAILAFQADNNLSLSGQVTDDLLAQLIKAPKREMTTERQTATKADLKAEPIVKTGDLLQKIGGAVVGGSLLGGGVDSLDDINARLTSAQNLYNTVTSFAPWLLYAATGGVIIFFGSRIIKKYVEAYREGRAL